MRLGNGFEIAFGLARSGDPVEQERREFFRAHRCDEKVRRRLLVGRQFGHGKVRIGRAIGPVDIDRHRLEQPATRPCRAARLPKPRRGRKLADRRLLALQGIERRGALRGKPRRLALPSAGIRSSCRRRAAPRWSAPCGRPPGSARNSSPRSTRSAGAAARAAAAPAALRSAGAACCRAPRQPPAAPSPRRSRRPGAGPAGRRPPSRIRFACLGNAVVEHAENGIENKESDAVHLAPL